jgi:hypothetical protein
MRRAATSFSHAVAAGEVRIARTSRTVSGVRWAEAGHQAVSGTTMIKRNLVHRADDEAADLNVADMRGELVEQIEL